MATRPEGYIDLTDAPLLSLITPVYRGEEFIESSIRAMLVAFEELRHDSGGRPPFELIVVCDGELDASAAIAHAVDDGRLQVVSYSENLGKGFALSAGMERARGDLIGWLDSDLDIDPTVILDAARLLVSSDIDAAVGSKRHPDSRVSYPWYRRVFSWGFQQLNRILLRVAVPDTQVGAKVFRREVIATALPLLRVKRYAFDLEVLAVAAQFGFDRVEEVPITLDYQFTGTGINHRAVWNMLQDTLAVAYRTHSRWYVHQFARMHRRTVASSDGNDPLMRPVVAAGNLALLRTIQGPNAMPPTNQRPR